MDEGSHEGCPRRNGKVNLKTKLYISKVVLSYSLVYVIDKCFFEIRPYFREMTSMEYFTVRGRTQDLALDQSNVQAASTLKAPSDSPPAPPVITRSLII